MLSSRDSFKQKETLFSNFLQNYIHISWWCTTSTLLRHSFHKPKQMHFLLRESYIKINCPHLMYVYVYILH